MKSGITSRLKAVDETDFEKLEYVITLIFTYGEEIKFAGINYFVD